MPWCTIRFGHGDPGIQAVTIVGCPSFPGQCIDKKTVRVAVGKFQRGEESMRSIVAKCCLLAVFSVIVSTAAYAQERATPEEIVQKVRQAADFLSKAGDAGLAEFSNKNGRWVWKDVYVWVLKCGQMTDAAHPFNQKLVGANLGGMKDAKGNYFFVQFCEKSREPKGAWIEYWWPKLGEKQPSRKISYVLAVPNSPYQVASGIHDDDITLEQLNQLLK